MVKVLFISAHAPTLNYPQAGQKIAFNNLLDYTLGCEVDILVIANQAEIDAATDLLNFSETNNNLYLYPITKLNKISSCLTCLHIPLKFAVRYRKAVAHKLDELLAKKTYDIIHFEYSHAAVYLDLILRRRDPHITQTVISIHDIVIQSFLRKAATNLILGIESARLFNFESNIYSRANQLWVLSQKDKDILTSLFVLPENKIFVKHPKLSNFVYRVQRRQESIENKSLLFWAAMGRPENEEAVLVFVEQCYKYLLHKDSEYKLYIVGANPTEKILKLACKNIIITGFVQDPTDYFERASIGIVPLLRGAGIKLKTLEMLEAGLTVISTSIGAEGVETSKQLVVSDDFKEWLELILKFCRM